MTCFVRAFGIAWKGVRTCKRKLNAEQVVLRCMGSHCADSIAAVLLPSWVADSKSADTCLHLNTGTCVGFHNGFDYLPTTTTKNIPAGVCFERVWITLLGLELENKPTTFDLVLGILLMVPLHVVLLAGTFPLRLGDEIWPPPSPTSTAVSRLFAGGQTP